MKWTTKQLQSALQAKNTEWAPLILVYGDDAGAVREYTQKLTEVSGVPLDDPFLSEKISAEELYEEEGKLLSSATTMSFASGLRLIRIEGVNGDTRANVLTAVTNAVKMALSTSLEDVRILIPAPGVGKDSVLAKAVEKDKTALAIRCFQDNAADLQTVIRQHLEENGKTIQSDALVFMVENLGADREITRQELDKLLLYVGTEQSDITLADCAASLSGAPAVNIFKLCDAVGLRDVATVDKMLGLLEQEGEDLNMIFALVVRHLRRLLQCKEEMGTGKGADDAMKALSPPVMFGKPEFMKQVSSYPAQRLHITTMRALDIQKQARSGDIPAELVLARGILSLAS